MSPKYWKRTPSSAHLERGIVREAPGALQLGDPGPADVPEVLEEDPLVGAPVLALERGAEAVVVKVAAAAAADVAPLTETTRRPAVQPVPHPCLCALAPRGLLRARVLPRGAPVAAFRGALAAVLLRQDLGSPEVVVVEVEIIVSGRVPAPRKSTAP